MKALSAVLLLAPLLPLRAQIDYRNLDAGRPLETADAAPLEHRTLELRLPYSFQSARSGASLHFVSPSLSAGVLPGLEFDAGLTGAATSGGDLSVAQAFADVTASLTTESGSWPALAITGALIIPTDVIAGRGSVGGAGLVATRTLGYTRIHFDGGLGIGRQQTSSLVATGSRWWAGAAVDRTLFRQSLLLVAALRASREVSGAPTGVTAGAGIRWQFSPVVVLDAGSTVRASHAGAPGFALSVGLSREWSWAGRRPAGAQ
jgi:hypothetical protein